MTRFGTPYFPSFVSACKYYAPTEEHSALSHVYGHNCPACETNQHVRLVVTAKIQRGEIYIGKPPIKPGDKLVLVDEKPGLRWHVETCNTALGENKNDN